MRSLAPSLLTLFAVPLHGQSPPTPTELPPVRRAAGDVQRGFADVARETQPSVVTVRAYERVAPPAAASGPAAPAPGWVGEEKAEDYPGCRLLAAASGFVVDASGDVLTCLHVLQRPDGTLADIVDIELADNARVLCEVVGTEPTVNLAILHAMVFPNGHARQLAPLRFGDSDALECGHWVLGFGDPAGPERFFAAGSFIQRPARDCYQDYLSSFYLQVAMTAPPEACGGPLVNLAGEVVGVLAPRKPKPGKTPSEPPTGIELALPSKIVVGLYESIRQVRSFQSPWLGFSVMSRAELAAARGTETFQKMAKPRTGIYIESVFRPGPAVDADIRPGDFLVGFGTTRVFTPVDFQRCMYLNGAGKTVELELFRDGETLKKTMQIRVRPPEAAPR